MDRLPAGFEIDKPRLVASAEVGKLSWTGNVAEPAHAEFGTLQAGFTALFWTW